MRLPVGQRVDVGGLRQRPLSDPDFDQLSKLQPLRETSCRTHLAGCGAERSAYQTERQLTLYSRFHAPSIVSILCRLPNAIGLTAKLPGHSDLSDFPSLYRWRTPVLPAPPALARL